MELRDEFRRDAKQTKCGKTDQVAYSPGQTVIGTGECFVKAMQCRRLCAENAVQGNLCQSEERKNVPNGAEKESLFQEREKFLHDADTFGVGCLPLW